MMTTSVRLRRRPGESLRDTRRRPGDATAGRGRVHERVVRTPLDGHPPLLDVSGIVVDFGGNRALAGVDVHAHDRVVTAVIGPNGAGKTTLFNVITGAVASSQGRVEMAGRDVTTASPRSRSNVGLARTFQNGALFESLTVAENIAAGVSRHARSGMLEAMLRAPRAMSDERLARAVVDRALRLLRLEAVADERCADLAYGLRRRTEIARGLAAAPRLLLLDEPSAGMDPVETRELADLLNEVVDNLAIGVLLVEHDMAMVGRCVDEMFVLNAGTVIARGRPADVLTDEVVRAAYFGKRGGHDA